MFDGDLFKRRCCMGEVVRVVKIADPYKGVGRFAFTQGSLGVFTQMALLYQQGAHSSLPPSL